MVRCVAVFVCFVCVSCGAEAAGEMVELVCFYNVCGVDVLGGEDKQCTSVELSGVEGIIVVVLWCCAVCGVVEKRCCEMWWCVDGSG